MSTSKLKTIAIVILLLVNIAFLALIVAQRVDSGRREHSVRENLVSVMEKNGITISTETIPKSTSLTEYRIGRDTEMERMTAESVLGECTVEDQGGNIFSYTGEKGSARFRGNGEFEINILPAFAAEFPQGGAEKLIKSMGISAKLISDTTEKNIQTVVFQSVIDDKPIFGCETVFTYENGGLTAVSGRRPTGEPEYRTERQFMTVSTVLMSFVSELSSGGHVCSSVEKIECGYMFFSSASGERTLTPVWRLETDTGSYFLHGITGIMVTS